MPVMQLRRRWKAPATEAGCLNQKGAPILAEIDLARLNVTKSTRYAVNVWRDHLAGKASMADVKHANQRKALAVSELQALSSNVLPADQSGRKSLYSR